MTHTKRAVERVDYRIVLAYGDGDMVSSIVSTTSDAGITVDAPTFDGDTITVWVSGGTAGTTYAISVVLATTVGRVLQADFRVKVIP